MTAYVNSLQQYVAYKINCWFKHLNKPNLFLYLIVQTFYFYKYKINYRSLQQTLSMGHGYLWALHFISPIDFFHSQEEHIKLSWLYQCHMGSYNLGLLSLHDTFPKALNKQLTDTCVFKSQDQKTLTADHELSSKWKEHEKQYFQEQ